jgi:hypothetical protein
MMMEKLVGETEVLGENLPQCRFVHQKLHMLCPDANPGRRGGKPATNLLSYGKAHTSNSWMLLNNEVERIRKEVAVILI